MNGLIFILLPVTFITALISYFVGTLATSATPSPEKAKDGPTALLPYKYEPGAAYLNTTNRWNNVFGEVEPNWGSELLAFQEQQAQNLNDQIT